MSEQNFDGGADRRESLDNNNLTRRSFISATAGMMAAAAVMGSGTQAAAESYVRELVRKKRVGLMRTLTGGLNVEELFTTPMDLLVEVMGPRLQLAVEQKIITAQEADTIFGHAEAVLDALRTAYGEPVTPGGLPTMEAILRQNRLTLDEAVMEASKLLDEAGVIVPWHELDLMDEHHAERVALFDGTYPDNPSAGDSHPADSDGIKPSVVSREQLGAYTIDGFYRTPKSQVRSRHLHLISVSKRSGMLGRFRTTGAGDDPQTKANGDVCSGNQCVDSTDQAHYCEPVEGGTECNSLSDHI